MKLLPYTAIDGIPTFPDSFVRGLFERMQDEDLVDAVFYDGSIKTPEAFLNMMKFGANRMFAISYLGETVGVIWLNNFRARSAECHFCFFSNVRGRDVVTVGQAAITKLVNLENISGAPLFDVIIGITPVNNRAAIRYCRRLGFNVIGTIPRAAYDAALGTSVDAQICCIERGKYGR